MTEADWNSSQDPQAMLAFLRNAGKLSERKARLFSVACCRRVWHLMRDQRSRKAVEVAGQFADGDASREEMKVARVEGHRAHEEAIAAVRNGDSSFRLSASWIAFRVARSKAAHGAREAIYDEWSLPEGTLDPHRQAVLADALEEADVTNPDVLSHCREEGKVHVRGCWLIDHLLARE